MRWPTFIHAGSMFQRTEPADCSIEWDGVVLPARTGEPLAAALLAAGVVRLRDTVLSGAPRGPFCMMGACFDCVVQVEGAVVQACMVAVTPGMKAAP